jgi:hypothetical protein
MYFILKIYTLVDHNIVYILIYFFEFFWNAKIEIF